jgi:hypothetical protein
MVPRDVRQLGTVRFHGRGAQVDHMLSPGGHMAPGDLRQLGIVPIHSREAQVDHMSSPGDHMVPHDAAVPPHPDVAWELEDPARPAKAQKTLLSMLPTSGDYHEDPATH